jgi:Flp pilus assembly pilin Flp
MVKYQDGNPNMPYIDVTVRARIVTGVHRRPMRGQGLVEYALIMLLVAVACVAAVSLFGGAVSTSLGTVIPSL